MVRLVIWDAITHYDVTVMELMLNMTYNIMWLHSARTTLNVEPVGIAGHGGSFANMSYKWPCV